MIRAFAIACFLATSPGAVEPLKQVSRSFMLYAPDGRLALALSFTPEPVNTADIAIDSNGTIRRKRPCFRH